MPFKDDNTSRRNLIVWSAFLIVYQLGGGSINGTSIKFPLINVELATPSSLSLLPWILLLWFAYRFHILHIGFYERDVTKAIWESWNRNDIADLVLKKIESECKNIHVVRSTNPIPEDDKPSQKKKYRILGIQASWNKGYVHYGKTLMNYGEFLAKSHNDMDFVRLNQTEARIIYFKCLQVPFTNYIMPHALSITAITLGAYCSLFGCQPIVTETGCFYGY